MNLFGDAFRIDELQKMFDLTGKTAIVNGAASGLGQAVAVGAAVFGANVVITDIDETNLEETYRELKIS